MIKVEVRKIPPINDEFDCLAIEIVSSVKFKEEPYGPHEEFNTLYSYDTFPSKNRQAFLFRYETDKTGKFISK